MNDEAFKSWFLNCNTGHKLNVMRDALITMNIGVFMQLVDIVLEAPLSQGGIATEDLQKAFGSDLTNPNHFTHGKRFAITETEPMSVETESTDTTA
tara:strand:+ start:2060 stop:2347 length:288 start_codon:yes stop_codon:yes gene_type:complete